MILEIVTLVLLGLGGLIEGCDPPFELVEGGCYYYNPDLYVESNDAANGFCLTLNGHVAMVKSGDENRAIVESLLYGDVQGVKVLLGATANELGLFEWIDGSLVRDGFNSWAPLEPSGNGDCMGYSTDDGLNWDDFQCGNYTEIGWNVGFLCEQPSGNFTTTTTSPGPTTTLDTTTTTTEATTTGSPFCPSPFFTLGSRCYYVSDNGYQWIFAQELCFIANSHIAYIKTEDEQVALQNYLQENHEEKTYFWIGAYDLFGTDDYYWLDGTPIDDGYTNWYYLEPSGASDDALFLYAPSYEWYDNQPINNYYYVICEIDI